MTVHNEQGAEHGQVTRDLSHVESSRGEKPQTVLEHDDAASKKNMEVDEVTWTHEEEAHALKKLDWNLIPL